MPHLQSGAITSKTASPFTTRNRNQKRKRGRRAPIQFSAKHLMLASPVFKKILTGGWKECYTFVKDGLVEIRMDSWDVNALILFFKIIHCQYHDVSRVLDLDTLAKVAALADFYGCPEVLSIFKDMSISNSRGKFPRSYCRDLLLWL